MTNIFLIKSISISKNLFFLNYLFIKKVFNLKKTLCLSLSRKSVKKFRGINKHRNVIIFANGPSVNNIDFEILNSIKIEKKIDYFCINNFLNSNAAAYISPDYYLIADPTYFKILEPWQEKFIDIIKSEEKVLLALRKNKITTFVPVDFENFAKNDVNFHLFNSFCHPSINNIKNPLLPLGCYPLAAMYALSIAIYMGYETVSIVGYDHSNFKNININIDNTLSERVEYFDSRNNIDVQYPLTVYKNISEYLLEYSIIFEQYYKYNNLNIYNLNLDGYIDAFIKKDIFSILK